MPRTRIANQISVSSVGLRTFRDKTAFAKTSDQPTAFQGGEERHRLQEQGDDIDQNREDDEAEVDTDLQLDAEMEEALQSYISSNEMVRRMTSANHARRWPPQLLSP